MAEFIEYTIQQWKNVTATTGSEFINGSLNPLVPNANEVFSTEIASWISSNINIRTKQQKSQVIYHYDTRYFIFLFSKCLTFSFQDLSHRFAIFFFFASCEHQKWKLDQSFSLDYSIKYFIHIYIFFHIKQRKFILWKIFYFVQFL